MNYTYVKKHVYTGSIKPIFIKYTISIADVRRILASGFKITSNLRENKNGFHFVLAVIKPFPFQFSHASCFFQGKGNEW